MPLIQDFFKAMGGRNDVTSQQDTANPHDNDDTTTTTTTTQALQTLDDIDNPHCSTLTRGHHERYLQVQRRHRHHPHQTELQKKEWQRLSSVVQAEQARYRQAMMDFVQRHGKRLALGFGPPSSSDSKMAQSFTTVVSHQVQLYRQAWEQRHTPVFHSGAPSSSPSLSLLLPPPPPPLHYLLSCCQRITIPRKAPRHRNNQQQLLLDSIQCQVVHTTATSTTSPTATNSTINRNRWEQALQLQSSPPPHNKDARVVLVSKPKVQDIPSVHLVRHDDKGLELCHQHQATIFTTVETLATLLQLSTTNTDSTNSAVVMSFQIPHFSTNTIGKSSSTSTSITKANTTTVHCLEIPLPQPCSTPRECLTRGFQEGLYQHFASSTLAPPAATSSSSLQSSQSPNFVYTLWTLPSATSKSPLRMMVRSIDRLTIMLPTDHSQTNATKASVTVPITVQASLEYFIAASSSSSKPSSNATAAAAPGNAEPCSFQPRSSWELPTSWEKSCWILDCKLHQPRGGRVYVAHIDPASATLLALEEKSIAHALAGDQVQQHQQQQQQHDARDETGKEKEQLPMNRKDNEDDPLVHWQALVDILHSIPTIRQGEHLLCFPHNAEPQANAPGSSVTLSVHPAMPSSTTVRDKDTTATNSSVKNPSWHVPTLFERANQVYLGETALRQSFRNWKWDRADRVPYTFPCP